MPMSGVSRPIAAAAANAKGVEEESDNDSGSGVAKVMHKQLCALHNVGPLNILRSQAAPLPSGSSDES